MTNREFFIQQMERHFEPFTRVLGALPESRLDYRPHPGSRSARHLVGHLLAEVQELEELTRTSRVAMRETSAFESLEEAVAAYRKAYEASVVRTRDLRDKEWEEACDLSFGPGRSREMLRAQAAWLLLHDMIHHRGQLSVYVRPMGGTLRTIFG